MRGEKSVWDTGLGVPCCTYLMKSHPSDGSWTCSSTLPQKCHILYGGKVWNVPNPHQLHHFTIPIQLIKPLFFMHEWPSLSYTPKAEVQGGQPATKRRYIRSSHLLKSMFLVERKCFKWLPLKVCVFLQGHSIKNLYLRKRSFSYFCF